MGKAPYGVLKRSPSEVPVVLLSGSVEDSDALLQSGFAAVLSATPVSMPLADALKPDIAAGNLRNAAHAIAGLQFTA